MPFPEKKNGKKIKNGLSFMKKRYIFNIKDRFPEAAFTYQENKFERRREDVPHARGK